MPSLAYLFICCCSRGMASLLQGVFLYIADFPALAGVPAAGGVPIYRWLPSSCWRPCCRGCPYRWLPCSCGCPCCREHLYNCWLPCCCWRSCCRWHPYNCWLPCYCWRSYNCCLPCYCWRPYNCCLPCYCWRPRCNNNRWRPCYSRVLLQLASLLFLVFMPAVCWQKSLIPYVFLYNMCICRN